MANEVYANGREISCKAGSGKSICAFPDVCFTPPTAPPTPPGVPIPYPNTGMASDTTSGSKKVKISRKEVMLKNKSYFKKGTGNEAGSAPKKGIVTSTHRPPGAPTGGKAYFNAWSIDVKVEGENVVRHLDLTTHNHASMPGDTPTWPYVDAQAVQDRNHPCHEEHRRERAACADTGIEVRRAASPGGVNLAATNRNLCADTDDAKECRKARRCMLQRYDKSTCCTTSYGGDEEAHHIVEAHGFSESRGVSSPSFPRYNLDHAPCVCAHGSRHTKEHGAFHSLVAHAEARAVRRARKQRRNPERAWRYGQARKAGLKSHKKIFPESECSEECLKHQVDAYHNHVGADDKSRLRTYDPRETPGQLQQWQQGPSEQVIDAMNQQLGAPAGAPG